MDNRRGTGNAAKAAVPEEDYSEELADYDDPEDDGPPWDEDDTESEDNE